MPSPSSALRPCARPPQREHTALLCCPCPLPLQVRFTNGISCGGAYIKLLTASPELSAQGLADSTPYSIMFGPDRCGQPTGKLHLIFRHRCAARGQRRAAALGWC